LLCFLLTEYPFPEPMTTQTVAKARRYQRISLPKGMSVAWYGGGDSQVSRVKTLGAGGLFLLASAARPVGTKLTLLFEVPGGFVQAEAVVRNILPGEGMGVEFTDVGPQARILLDDLLKRLLR
jgi:PilZ domain